MPRMEPPPPPQMETTEPPPPPPPEQLELAADSVKVHFFGVADNDWNLGVNGIGIKKGTTGKGEFSFYDTISLKIDSKYTFDTVAAFADFVLKTCLHLSAADLLYNQVKVIKLDGVQPGRAPPTELVDLSLPVLVSHAAGGVAKVELMLYVRARQLHAARARAASERWDLFKERAAQVIPGFKVGVAKVPASVT